MISFIIAQIFGAIALSILVLSFQKNNRKRLLEYQMISSLLYALQYVFLKAYTGCAMNLLCMFRNFIFNKFQERKPPTLLLIVIIFVMIIFSFFTYTELISVLPTLAVILYSIAIWNGNMKIIRITEIISCLLFIIYNIKVFAITGLIATVVEMFAAIVALYRFDIKNNRKKG